MRGNPIRKSGSSLVESCIVLALLCLILFGILQVSYLIGSKDVLSYAAMASARSAQVGYNDFMLEKTARVISIPSAGPIINPNFRRSGAPDSLTPGERWDRSLHGRVYSRQFYTERYRIPFYLGAEERSYLSGILDYDNWQAGDTLIQVSQLEGSQADAALLDVGVSQNVPMVMPFAGVFARLLPDRNMVRVYRSDTRGLAQNTWSAEATAGNFEVPAVELQNSIRVENHASYYMETAAQ